MPNSQFSSLLRPNKLESLSLTYPYAKARYGRLPTESWAICDSKSSSSQKKKEAKREILKLSKTLIKQMLNNAFEDHMGAAWRPCQEDETGLITLCSYSPAVVLSIR